MKRKANKSARDIKLQLSKAAGWSKVEKGEKVIAGTLGIYHALSKHLADAQYYTKYM